MPIVADRRPVRALVFVAGIIGMPGKSLADLADSDADRDGVLEEGDIRSAGDGMFIFTEQGALRTLYHDCEPGTAVEAAHRLRPQRSMWTQVLPILAWPTVPMASIVCTQDRIVNRPWAERIARERLGVKPVLVDSGHSPMLSHPGLLAEILTNLVIA